MAQRGTLSDAGPSACPFVALELDRDRRSERPDYRHRCYAEQVPAPRTIAHQERFCLSPNFSGCPIFQDWAVRAAARPVPLPPGYEGGRRATPDPRGAGMAGAAATSMSMSESAPSAGDRSPAPADSQPEEGWPDSMATSVPLVGAAAAAEGLAAEPVVEQQLSAFDAQAINSVDSALPADASSAEASSAASGDVSPLRAPVDRTPMERPRGYEATDPIDLEEPDGAAVPAFLAGRSSRPPRSPKVDDGVHREDVVPSWEIDGRFGAQAGGEPRGDGVFGRLLTIAAVVIILALGIAAVILIPGLLSGSPQQTTRPSVLRTASPRVSGIAVVPTSTPTQLATPSPIAEPTAAATPEPYKIKAGDTLARIARKNGITVDQILAANPQITDANDIQVGQFIVIPLPAATPAP